MFIPKGGTSQVPPFLYQDLWLVFVEDSAEFAESFCGLAEREDIGVKLSFGINIKGVVATETEINV